MANIYPVKITINETEMKQRNRFYMVITVGEVKFDDKIKEAFTNTGMHSVQSEESLSVGDASLTIILTEFVSNFNRDEGIIIKNLPDGLLNELQQQIKQKILENDRQKEAEISEQLNKEIDEYFDKTQEGIKELKASEAPARTENYQSEVYEHEQTQDRQDVDEQDLEEQDLEEQEEDPDLK